MTAAIYNITIEQGATWSRTLTWNDSTGTPVNLEGWSAEAQFRASYGDEDAVLTLLSGEAGGITLGDDAGTITLTIDAEATAGLTAPADGVWDLELTTGDEVTRLVQGTYTVSPEATK